MGPFDVGCRRGGLLSFLRMNAQLAEISDQFRSISRRAEAVVARAGEARIAVRPRPDSWSIAECLAHLTVSTEICFPAWSKSLADARASGLTGQGPYRVDLIGGAFAWFLEPPARLRAKAPAHLQPVGTESPGEVLPRFLASQDRLLRVLADAEGLALDRMKIGSPVDSRVRYSVWSSFRLTAAHQRRHLWQAERAAT
jgi:hypothetical protein